MSLVPECLPGRQMGRIALVSSPEQVADMHLLTMMMGYTITLDKRDSTAVILDVIPQVSEILLNERVIGSWPNHTQFCPGHVTNV